jgi:hypothetical protein
MKSKVVFSFKPNCFWRNNFLFSQINSSISHSPLHWFPRRFSKEVSCSSLRTSRHQRVFLSRSVEISVKVSKGILNLFKNSTSFDLILDEGTALPVFTNSVVDPSTLGAGPPEDTSGFYLIPWRS